MSFMEFPLNQWISTLWGDNLFWFDLVTLGIWRRRKGNFGFPEDNFFSQFLTWMRLTWCYFPSRPKLSDLDCCCYQLSHKTDGPILGHAEYGKEQNSKNSPSIFSLLTIIFLCPRWTFLPPTQLKPENFLVLRDLSYISC